MAGGRKLRVSCGPVATFNPSKQEAKGGSDEAQDLIVLSMSNELLYLVPELHTHTMTVNDGVGGINHLSCHEMSCARAVLYKLLLMTVKLRGTAKSEKILNKFGWYLVGCLSL